MKSKSNLKKILGRKSVFVPILFAIFAIVCNALIAISGVSVSNPTGAVPQGWAWVNMVVGYVWVVLFAVQGCSWNLVRASTDSQLRDRASYVVALAVICLFYPFTFGLTAYTGLLGNVLIAAFAVWVMRRIFSASKLATVFLAPTVIWLGLASVYLTMVIQLNRY
jgi:tryptophan-rich sensory protein